MRTMRGEGLFLGAFLVHFSLAAALLYPRESQYREVKELNGLWHFRADDSPSRNAGFDLKWFQQPLSKTGETLLMPVPSSFNDITQDADLRVFVGWVWYDRQAWVPKAWLDGKTTIMLRVESAHYNSIVWVNGVQIVEHSGGHLPFEGDVTDLVNSGASNLITIAVNNTLTPNTLPPGTLGFTSGRVNQNLQMDFFNYAGIHRPVKLYTMPAAVHIDDITVATSFTGFSSESAHLNYTLQVSGTSGSGFACTVQLMNRKGEAVASNTHVTQGCQGKPVCEESMQGAVTVDTPTLWWPWTMSSDPGYLYTFQVNVSTENGSEKISDLYRQPIGIRTVKVTATQFLINGKPFYFHGVGKHEDANIRGKGLDYPLMMKDINLMMWLGINSFRTSHYPYAEELMDLCDKYGIVVIDELPAVGLNNEENFASETLLHHLDVMGELIARDKNRPSVVMYSLANEPNSELDVAESYFQSVADRSRLLDPTRPVTFATKTLVATNDKAVQFMDVVCHNRYFGWYQDTGFTGGIEESLSQIIESWYTFQNKPILITEYGASAIAGLHKDPPTMYTEEYQAAIYSATFPVFDKYRTKYFIGEMVWNFADFETAQTTNRADGNKKGLLTRERQPKLGAQVVRTRYHKLASEAKDLSQSCSAQTQCRAE